jgi:disulfide bond formation protein DsbB
MMLSTTANLYTCPYFCNFLFYGIMTKNLTLLRRIFRSYRSSWRDLELNEKTPFFSPLSKIFNWWCSQPQLLLKPFHISAILIFCYTDHEISIAETNFQKLPLKLEGYSAYWKSPFFGLLPNIFNWCCSQQQLILKPFHISTIFIFCYTDHEISIVQKNFQKLPLMLRGSRAYWKSPFLAFYHQLINFTVFYMLTRHSV